MFQPYFLTETMKRITFVKKAFIALKSFLKKTYNVRLTKYSAQ